MVNLDNLPFMDRLYNAEHFMFDFETTGLNTEEHAIIEIGIVNFKLRYGNATQNKHTFTQAVLPHLSKGDDPKTIEWHTSDIVRNEHYQHLKTTGIDPLVGFSGAVAWVQSCIGSDKEGYFWSKPAQFDWPFWCSHLKTFSLTNPFPRRNVIDVRSFVSGLIMSGHRLSPDIIDKWFDVSSHKALEDATLQVELIHKAMGFIT